MQNSSFDLKRWLQSIKWKKMPLAQQCVSHRPVVDGTVPCPSVSMPLSLRFHGALPLWMEHAACLWTGLGHVIYCAPRTRQKRWWMSPDSASTWSLVPGLEPWEECSQAGRWSQEDEGRVWCQTKLPGQDQQSLPAEHSLGRQTSDDLQ